MRPKTAHLNNKMMKYASLKDASRWGNAPFGSEFDGSKAVLNIQNNLNSFKYSGMALFKPLTEEQREKIKEMQEREPN